jgi:hypothetical protein
MGSEGIFLFGLTSFLSLIVGLVLGNMLWHRPEQRCACCGDYMEEAYSCEECFRYVVENGADHVS